MEGIQGATKRTAITAAAIAGLLQASCMTFEESGLPGSAASMAHNQIMLVSAGPEESFGHYRLVSLMRIYPDLEVFTAKRGIPDFLAETSNRQQHYYILYYLKNRQAYAARTRPPQRNRLEFAGPYPVTEKEKRILEDLRKKEAPRSLSRGLPVE